MASSLLLGYASRDLAPELKSAPPTCGYSLYSIK